MLNHELKLSKYLVEAPLADGEMLLANILWRTHVLLNEDGVRTWSAFKNNSTLDMYSPQFIADMRQNMIFVDYSLDEASVISERYAGTRFAANTLGLTIAPTIDCNFACLYCYEEKKPGMMSRQTESSIIDYVRRNLDGKKSFAVTWYGGEPLLAKDTVIRLSEAFTALCTEYQVQYHAFLITNGSLLKPNLTRRLAKLGHWRNVQITLDGTREFHNLKRPTKGAGGSFDVILRHLLYAIDHLPMLLRMNVDILNPSSCRMLLDELAQHELAKKLCVYFSPIHPFGEGCRDLAQKHDVSVIKSQDFAEIEIVLMQHAKALGFKTRDVFDGPWLQQCQAVSSHSYLIEPSGSIQRCWIEVGECNKAIGNINEPIVLNSNNNIRWLSFDPTRNTPCRDCHVLPLCFGSCPHRHITGAPEEFTCNSIKHNLHDRLILDVLTKYYPHKLKNNLFQRNRLAKFSENTAPIKFIPIKDYRLSKSI